MRLLTTLILLTTCNGCLINPLSPRQIVIDNRELIPQPLDMAPQMQRGKPRPIIDAVGWVVGIPGKLILADRRVDNHNISLATEGQLAEYLEVNGNDHTRVRINQYRPGEDWRRLIANRSVNPLIRFTFGSVSVLGETIFPGRIFGGDHYNPFTDTIHLYSDIPAVALHEAGHAKDFSRRQFKGLYALGYGLPLAPLYYEKLATADVFAYYELYGTPEQHADAARILYPAYGTYVGSAGGYLLPRYEFPLFIGGVLAGHAAGRVESQNILNQVEAKPRLDRQYRLGEPILDLFSNHVVSPLD